MANARRSIFVAPNRRAKVAPEKFDPTAPVLAFDPSPATGAAFSATDQSTILAAFQQLTNDTLSQQGLQIFADGKGSGGSFPRGTALFRSVQSKTQKVLIRPTGGSMLPETALPRGGDPAMYVELDLNPFKLFTLDALQFLTRGGTAMSPPSYVSNVEVAPLFVIVAHEFVHVTRVLRRQNLPLTTSVTNFFCDDSGWQFREAVFTEESIVVGLNSERMSENGIRLEHGLNLRVAYTSPTLPMGSAFGAAKPSPYAQGAVPLPNPMTGDLAPTWWPDHP